MGIFTEKIIWHEITELASLLIYGMIVIAISLFVGFRLGGFETSSLTEIFSDPFFNKVLIYSTLFLIAGVIGVIALKIINIVQNRKDGKAIIQAMIHDPSQGFLYGYLYEKNNIKLFRWTGSFWRVFFLFLLIFAIFGLIGSSKNTFLTGTPQITFQVTEFAKGFYAIEPASTGETLFILAFPMFLILSFFKWLQYKLKFSDGAYWFIVILLVPLMMGSIWQQFHTLRYGNSEVSLFATFIFGYLSTLFLLFFGILLIPILFHQNNNFFAHITDSFGIEKILFFVIAYILILAGINALIWFNKKAQTFQDVTE